VKDSVRVAVVQMSPEWLKPEQNRERMAQHVHELGGSVDLVVFPELCTTGYVTGRDREFGGDLVACSELADGPTARLLGAAARGTGCHVVFGLSELHPVIPATLYNSALVLGADGALVGVHRKLHIPVDEKHFYMEGESFAVFSTAVGALGISICYDNWFPELWRAYALRGAEIVVSPINAHLTGDSGRLFMSELPRVRAFENRCFVIACNRVGTETRGDTHRVYSGMSGAYDPFGKVLAAAEGDEETVLLASLERRTLEQARTWLPVFRDRRPDLFERSSNGETG